MARDSRLIKFVCQRQLEFYSSGLVDAGFYAPVYTNTKTLAMLVFSERPPFENKVILISPQGQFLSSYLKSQPVPGEAVVKGDGIIPRIATPYGVTGSVICYDLDFPGLIGQLSQREIDLLITPANDWKEVKFLHMQMVTFRALEQGVPIFRPTSHGVSAAIDSLGRVISNVDYFQQTGAASLQVTLGTGKIFTIYSKIGDLVAWICTALTVVLILAGLFFRPKSPVYKEFDSVMSNESRQIVAVGR